MHLSFLLLAALLALAAATAPRWNAPHLDYSARNLDESGTPVTTQAFPVIFGGDPAGPDIVARVAKLRMCFSGGCGSCSAPVLNRKWLATAAHCLSSGGAPARSVQVTLDGRTYDANLIIIKQGYVTESRLTDDIGLIRITGKLSLPPGGKGADIKFKPTARASQIPADLSVVEVAGFGQTAPNTGSTNTLMQGDTTLYPRSSCGSYTDRGFLCTRTGRAEGVLCPGDSGGPMFVAHPRGGYRLVGINSAVVLTANPNFQCGDANTWHVYADFSKYWADIKRCFKRTCVGWFESDIRAGSTSWSATGATR